MSEIFSARPSVARWNVSGQDDPSALDFYRNGISDWYQASDFDPDRTFFTDNLVYQFGPYVLGRGRSVGQVLLRGHGEIRRSGLDSVAIMLDLAGIKGDVDGLDVNTPAGTFHFRDLRRPSASKVDAVDALVLSMPRGAAPRWLVEQNFHGVSIDRTLQISRLLAGHLTVLLGSAPSLSVEDGVARIEAALVMAERAVINTGHFTNGQTEAVYRGLRTSAARLIDQMLHTPELRIERLTHALGVSRATLFRAFALSGGIKLYIKRRRLELAHAALLARIGRRPTIGEIAHAHGFVSESHFSRSFKDHYGHAPGSLQPLEPLPPSEGGTAGIRYDLVLDWMNGDESLARLGRQALASSQG